MLANMVQIFSRFSTSENLPIPLKIRWHKRKEIQENQCPFMFPRVYESTCVSEHELTPLCSATQDDDDNNFNIVDKFVRVINLKNVNSEFFDELWQ